MKTFFVACILALCVAAALADGPAAAVASKYSFGKNSRATEGQATRHRRHTGYGHQVPDSGFGSGGHGGVSHQVPDSGFGSGGQGGVSHQVPDSGFGNGGHGGVGHQVPDTGFGHGGYDGRRGY